MKSYAPKIEYHTDPIPGRSHAIQYQATALTPWGQTQFVMWYDDRKITKKRQQEFNKMAERALFRYLEKMIEKRRKQRRLKK